MTFCDSMTSGHHATSWKDLRILRPLTARFVFGLLLALALVAPQAACAQGSDLVYISNVGGTDGPGEAPTTIEEQTAVALDQLGLALREQGLDYADVVVSNVFLRDTRHFQGMNGVYRTYFQSGPPTRATVQADLLHPDALIQISVIAARGPREIITPSGLKSPELPYSWGVKVGSTLFLSGATSRSPETYQPVPGGVATQTRRVFGNLGLVLEEAGMSYADLVSCKVFLDDPRGFADMNGAYAEFVTADDPPARATVRAPLMNVLFSSEIQCVAEESAERQVVRPEGQPRPRSPYSPGIDVGSRVYFAGVTGRGADAAEETRDILSRLQGTMDAASVGYGDVENIWVYLADIRDWEAVQGALTEVMGNTMPTPTVVGTRTMGQARVEIQIVVKR